MQFHIEAISRHEAVAGNPLHCALILGVLGLLLLRAKEAALRPALLLSAGLIVGFVLFCALLKWQPWHVRLHLPLFVFWSAVAGTVLARVTPRGAAALAMVMLLAATPYVLANRIRPILATDGFTIFTAPRVELYFADRLDAMASFQAAASFTMAQHCDSIGLDLASNRYEYPLQVLLHNLTGSRPVRNVRVGNLSRVYSTGAGLPTCLICPSCGYQRPDWATLTRQFATVEYFGDVAVLSGWGRTKPNVCTAEFSGWYDVERHDGDWARWSSGEGLIRVTASQDLDASLDGVVTAAPAPSVVRLIVNGVDTRIRVRPEGSPLRGIAIHLRKGENVIDFISEKPAVHVPPDTRLLSVMVKDLDVRSATDVRCSLEQ